MAADNRRTLDYIQQFNLRHETEGLTIMPAPGKTVSADDKIETVRIPRSPRLPQTQAQTQTQSAANWIKPVMLVGGGLALVALYIAILKWSGKTRRRN